MAQITYDFLVGLTTVTDDSVQWLRKTSERPPRVSVYDVLSLVTGVDAANCTNVWNRLVEQCPEVLTLSKNFKFPGRGQRGTPVTDAKGIVTIIMLLHGRAGAEERTREASSLKMA